MNKQAILHIQDSQYAYALDAHTIRVMLRTAAGDRFARVDVVYGNKYDYYKRRKRACMEKRFTDGTFDYYIADIRVRDVRFVYIFELAYEGEVCYFSEDGVTAAYDFRLAYYNCFQLPFINGADITGTVEWMKRASFYEIFVDRFFRANREKDDRYINLPWGELPAPKSFAGGDLDGIAEKLGYLQSLGIDALYLTPVFRSVSNHKYDVGDYFCVDEMFGGDRALKDLIGKAHARGMKVILDAVFNHCSENTREFRDVLERGKQSPYFDWFIIHGDGIDPKRANYEYFSLCKYMPKWNTSNPQVQEFLNGIAAYWIEKYDIDGWRLDVSDEVSHDYWRSFRKTVKSLKPSCVILGENWHDSNPYLRGDQFDGIMNYALTKACLDYFARRTVDAEGFANRLGGLYVRNTEQVNAMMLNLLDSHDTHRFYSETGKDADLLLCALAVIYLHTGAPCVYYGTEIPMEGGYDPDCRRTMVWNGKAQLKEAIFRLGRLRRRKEVVEGNISFGAGNGMFVLKRSLRNTVRLTVNNSGEEKPFAGEGELLLSHRYAEGTLSHKGFAIELIRGKGGEHE